MGNAEYMGATVDHQLTAANQHHCQQSNPEMVAASNYQDWNTVVFTKSSHNPRTKTEKAQSQREGNIETVAKFSTGNAHHKPSINAAKLDADMESTKHATVSLELRTALQKARQAKGMTQEALATALNERAQVINDYESGKAIPNTQLIGKMERTLGCKLPRPKK